MRILIFGDSITYGEFDTQGGWAERLKVQYFKTQIDHPGQDAPLIYNLGFGGDVTRHVAERLPAETEARRSLWSGNTEFAFVFAIGINDSVRDDGKYFSTPEQYGKDLEALYTATTKFSSKVLFVGLTPIEPENSLANHRYNNDRIWQFEQVLRDFAAKHSLPFVPLFETLKKKIEAGERLYVDGLHPNDAGHAWMYEQIRPRLTELLT